jgi:hypothetical protein
MAYNYYDSDSGTATTISGATFTITWDSSCTTATNVVYHCAPPRRILIPKPEKWTREQELAFVRLLNEQVRCGWRVEMLISGDVLICDPNIETRDMADMVPLLKLNANEDDKATIRQFFVDNPLS